MSRTPYFHKFIILVFLTFFACLGTFTYGNSSVGIIKIDTLPKSQAAPASQAMPKFRIGVQIGYAYRFGRLPKSIDPGMKDYLTKLKNNLSYGADISYYFKNNIGLGVKYTGLSRNASISDVTLKVTDELGNITILQGPLLERVGIHYIGGFFAARYFIKPNKQCFFASIGFGYMMYSDAIFINEKMKETGNTGAFTAEMGYDIFASKYLAVGLQLSVTLAALNSASYTVGNVTVKEKLVQRENLSYLNISLGFRFYK